MNEIMRSFLCTRGGLRDDFARGRVNVQNANYSVQISCKGKPMLRCAIGFTLLANMLLASAEDIDPQMENVMPSAVERLYINNRRYLGNKYKLLSAIRQIVDDHCENVRTFVDVFAGTGSVASAFPDKKLILNDILYSNYICHIAWFSGEKYSEKKIANLIKGYNAIQVTEENYMSETFADTYFSAEDCRKIGYIRENIDWLYSGNEINARERALLITSLLYAMDKIANTVGHYDAYRKGVEAGSRLVMKLPTPPKCEVKDNECYRKDANELARELPPVDVFFMDPPYNSRQYGDAYHLLENVAEWKQPKVVGVAKKMDRSAVKSDYCTKKAEDAFADLVSQIKARYIVLTYNNMAEQGNDRSNAKLSDEAILSSLQSRGEVMVFNVEHKAFSAGKSNRDNNVERIFLCKCEEVKRYVASPLNYTGGKFKIIDQLMTNFPQKIDRFVDLFCGGCNVGINANARSVLFMDSSTQLIDMFSMMQRAGSDKFITDAKALVQRFGLSDSNRFGYAHYGCKSITGLGSYNKEAYFALRKHYSELQEKTMEKSVALYVLVVYGFNNQIRFNSKGEYNLPVGKRDMNAKMIRKATDFINRIHRGDYEFRAGDFRTLDVSVLGPNDFVYADPPYLITTATYNENDGWTEKDEIDLLNLLDRIDDQGSHFALSNVTESNGKTNVILRNWIELNCGRYRVVDISRDYSNSNYQRKNAGTSHEVLIVNY